MLSISPRRLLPSCPVLFRLSVLSLAAVLGACAVPSGSGLDNSGATIGRATPGDETRPIPSGPLPPNGDLAANPRRFEGYAAGQVIAALGDPNFRRHEAPAEVWQYYGPGCVLDLFLYQDHGAERVTHVELRNQLADQDSASACMSHLLDGHRGQRSS